MGLRLSVALAACVLLAACAWPHRDVDLPMPSRFAHAADRIADVVGELYRETAYEVYYALEPHSTFALTPAVQYVNQPGGSGLGTGIVCHHGNTDSAGQ